MQMTNDTPHSKCYAGPLGGCSSKISHEHYISRKLLEQIDPRPIVESGVHVGSPDGRYGISSLTAKILCTKHNSQLSPLDTEAAKLYEAIDAFETSAASQSAPTAAEVTLDGALLERWFLKVAFGVCKGGVATGQGSKITALRNEDALLRVLYGLEIPPTGWGLYATLPSSEFAAPANFGLEPRTNPETGEVMQLVVWVRAFEFRLCLGIPSPVTPEQYRPGGLRLSESGTSRSLDLKFIWADGSTEHSILEMTRVGQRQDWDSRSS